MMALTCKRYSATYTDLEVEIYLPILAQSSFPSFVLAGSRFPQNYEKGGRGMRPPFQIYSQSKCRRPRKPKPKPINGRR
jgi:hypothetical protein